MMGAASSVAAQDPPSSQDTRDEEASEEKSRLLPNYGSGSTLSPPATLVPPPAPAAKVISQRQPSQQALKSPTSSANIVEYARLCREVVSPDYSINVENLVGDGWGYTQPSQATFGAVSAEIVRYYKDQDMIALIDLGPVVVCRVVSLIKDENQFLELRSALVTNLPAQEFFDADGMDKYRSHILRNSPSANTLNIFVAGDYSIEMSIDKRDLAGTGITGAKSATFAMLEIGPIDPKLLPNR